MACAINPYEAGENSPITHTYNPAGTFHSDLNDVLTAGRVCFNGNTGKVVIHESTLGRTNASAELTRVRTWLHYLSSLMCLVGDAEDINN